MKTCSRCGKEYDTIKVVCPVCMAEMELRGAGNSLRTRGPSDSNVVESAKMATEIFQRLVREQSDDVLMWLRSYFARTPDFGLARQWIEMPSAERARYIDSLR